MTAKPFPVDRVSPTRLIGMMEESHWVKTGGRDGLYVRYAPPESADILDQSPSSAGDHQSSDAHGTPSVNRTIVVPLDMGAPDYHDLMADALESLRWLPSPSARYTWLSRLTTSPTDQVSFAKETRAPKGWIQWDEGESLISAARGVLMAGAKSAREPLSYFGNKHGQFANRFLDEVMMGQTAVGSYVVRAYVPTDAAIPLKGSKESLEGMLFSDSDALNSREVSEAVVQTLSNTVEALNHFNNRESLSAFTDAALGLSYESVTAVKRLAENSDAANVIVSWDEGRAPTSTAESEFTFDASHVPILERAAHALVAPQPQREATAEGRVHLLSRDDADGPGVVGITTLDGTPAKKLRVHLGSEDYHRALGAHDLGSLVQVAGNLEREGNLSYLYQARITRVSRVTEPGQGSRQGRVLRSEDQEIPFEGW